MNSISSCIEELTGKENFRPKLDSLKEKISLNISSKTKVIIIGGTNGKGETCFRLEQMFSELGRKVVSFSSPHLKCASERFKYNGEAISKDDFFELIESYKLEAEGLSFYEFTFLLFTKWIQKMDLDYIILEVGLGGRWDATNLIDADLAIISSISRDHIAILGNSYKKILCEKIEITRKNRRLLTNFHLDYLKKMTRDYCDEKQVDWINLNLDQGFFSARNTQLAYEAFKLFEKENMEILNKVSNKKRGYDFMEKRGSSIAYFSGAHNLDGMRHSLKAISSHCLSKVVVSFSRRDKKELKYMVKMLGNLVGLENIYLTRFDHFKALAFKEVSALADEMQVDNIVKFKDLKFEDKTLYIGSIYFIGELHFHFDL